MVTGRRGSRSPQNPANPLPVTLFDLIAVVVVLLSVLAGLSNGAVRELVGLTAFGMAVVGAFLLLPVSRPVARALVHPSWAASAVAIAVAFLLIYIGLQVTGRFLTARLRDAGALGQLDRLGGAGIGAVRAGVLLGAFYLFYRAVTPVEYRPIWIERAALLPVSAAAGETLQRLTPKGATAAGRLGPSLKDALTSPDGDAGIAFGSGSKVADFEPELSPTPSPARADRRHRGEADRRGETSSSGLNVVVEHRR